METKASVAKSWDDLVFENRNHEYGAYVVRKAYTNNLASGFALSISLAGALLLIPVVSALWGDSEVMAKGPETVYEDPFIFEEVPDIEVLKPNVALPPPPANDVEIPVEPNVPVQVTATADMSNTVPTNEALESTPPVEFTDPAGVPGGTGTEPVTAGATDMTGTGGGTGTGGTEYYIAPQVMPAYTGGMEAMYEFIRSKIRYPGSARRIGLEGTVFVSFVIDRTGKVTEVKVIRGLSTDCDKEAARVIGLLPGWNPGKQNNLPVLVRMTLPIKFAMSKV